MLVVLGGLVVRSVLGVLCCIGVVLLCSVALIDRTFILICSPQLGAGISWASKARRASRRARRLGAPRATAMGFMGSIVATSLGPDL